MIILFTEKNLHLELKDGSVEDLDSIPSTYSSKLFVTPVPGDPVPFFWPPWAPDTQVVHKHTGRQDTHTHTWMDGQTDR